MAQTINKKINNYKKKEKQKGKASINSPFSSKDSNDEIKRNIIETDYRPSNSKNSCTASGSFSKRKLDRLQYNTPYRHSTLSKKSILYTRFDFNLVL